MRWGGEAASSCIYESIPGHRCTSELRSSHAAYQQHRSHWPLRPTVWQLLFCSQLTRLVQALLGSHAVLFNDQVGLCGEACLGGSGLPAPSVTGPCAVRRIPCC